MFSEDHNCQSLTPKKKARHPPFKSFIFVFGLNSNNFENNKRNLKLPQSEGGLDPLYFH
jgi:hypothetical protein